MEGTTEDHPEGSSSQTTRFERQSAEETARCLISAIESRVFVPARFFTCRFIVLRTLQNIQTARLLLPFVTEATSGRTSCLREPPKSPSRLDFTRRSLRLTWTAGTDGLLFLPGSLRPQHASRSFPPSSCCATFARQQTPQGSQRRGAASALGSRRKRREPAVSTRGEENLRGAARRSSAARTRARPPQPPPLPARRSGEAPPKALARLTAGSRARSQRQPAPPGAHGPAPARGKTGRAPQNYSSQHAAGRSSPSDPEGSRPSARNRPSPAAAAALSAPARRSEERRVGKECRL